MGPAVALNERAALSGQERGRGGAEDPRDRRPASYSDRGKSSLARALHATVEIDRVIPVEHSKAVAEVIGYVMRLRRAIAVNFQPPCQRNPCADSPGWGTQRGRCFAALEDGIRAG